jgi:hypothetical protein
MQFVMKVWVFLKKETYIFCCVTYFVIGGWKKGSNKSRNRYWQGTAKNKAQQLN